MLRHCNPADFQARLKEGYIQGVAVDSPAVISVNGFAASHAVNEPLARLHAFRIDDNAEFRYQVLSLRDGVWLKLPDGSSCDVLRKRVGRGDTLKAVSLAGTIRIERVSTVWRAWVDETKSSSRASTGGGPNGAAAD